MAASVLRNSVNLQAELIGAGWRLICNTWIATASDSTLQPIAASLWQAQAPTAIPPTFGRSNNLPSVARKVVVG
jgi:hypothetical protein